MRLTKWLDRFFVVMAMFFMIGYAGSAMGNDRVITDQYTVKLSDVLCRRDIAESILLRIQNECKCKEVHAYDRIKERDILLSKIEDGMDVDIMGSELMLALSDMYKEYLGKIKDGDASLEANQLSPCVTKETIIGKDRMRIMICMDKREKKVVHLMVMVRGKS